MVLRIKACAKVSSCGDVAATDSVLSFERSSGLYTFGKKSERGRRMVEEKFEKDMSQSS